jgi:hypothetical protein
MMLVPLSMTNVALALIVLRLRSVGHGLVGYAFILAAAILAVVLQYGHQRTSMIEGAAKQWIAATPGQIEVEASTRKYLALVPGVESLPGLNAKRPLLILATATPCDQWLSVSGASEYLQLVRSQKNTRVAVLGIGGALCLFRYDKPTSGEVMDALIRRARLKERIRTGQGYVAPSQVHAGIRR